MVCDPYICINPTIKAAGKIEWWFPPAYEGAPFTSHNGCTMRIEDWQEYASFEREKLRELGADAMITLSADGYMINTRWVKSSDAKPFPYNSRDMVDYPITAYICDSESSRLLNRAEFLRAVCEKEGVEYLPKEKLVLPEGTLSLKCCGACVGKCCGCNMHPTRPCNEELHCTCKCHKLSETHTVDPRPDDSFYEGEVFKPCPELVIEHIYKHICQTEAVERAEKCCPCYCLPAYKLSPTLTAYLGCNEDKYGLKDDIARIQRKKKLNKL